MLSKCLCAVVSRVINLCVVVLLPHKVILVLWSSNLFNSFSRVHVLFLGLQIVTLIFKTFGSDCTKHLLISMSKKAFAYLRTGSVNRHSVVSMVPELEKSWIVPWSELLAYSES
jgi:hypothetical protein